MESFKNLGDVKDKKFLGSGSYGRVYKFEYSEGEFYAVKVSDVKKESDKEVAFGELEVLLKLKDIGATSEMKPIPQVYGCELKNNKFSVLMTKFYGKIRDNNYVDPVYNMNFRKILMLITDAAETLKSIHDTGILHGDLQPGNMMFINKDLTRIGYIDFGFSRGKDSALRVGKVLYNSPEIIFLEKFNAEKNELWSFGTSIGEMIFNFWIVSRNSYSYIQHESPTSEEESSIVSKYINKMRLNFNERAGIKRESWTLDCGELSFKAFSDAFLGIFTFEKDRISLADFIKGMKNALDHCDNLYPPEKAQSSCESCIPGCEIFII